MAATTLAIVVGVAVLLGGAIWWAVSAQSVATLDRVDGWFTGDEATLATGPVRFGQADAQRLYVWTPADAPADASLPVVVFIHGGSWATGDPADYGFVGRNLASRGYVTVVAGYRLGEEGVFPAMLQDGAAAIGWTARNIADFGGDPGRIAVMGHSAGAYNAAMLALDRQWLAAEGLPADTIDAVVGLAGPYDFYPFDSQSTRNAFGGWSDPAETQPVNFAREDAPPLLLLHGDADETVKPRNATRLAEVVEQAGGRATAQSLDGVGHIGILLQLARPFDRDRRVKQAVFAVLDRQLAKPRSSVPVQRANR